MEYSAHFLPEPEARFKILHIEDDPIWAGHIAKLVRSWPEFQSVGIETTGATGIERCQQTSPDVLLLDLRLPDMDGFSVLEALVARGVHFHALLLSCKNDEVTLQRTRSSRALGMVSKSSEIDGLLRSALSAVAVGRQYFSPDVHSAIRRATGASDAYHKILSDREQEVVRLVASGHADYEIAASLGISASTIHRHRQNVMNKLDLHSTPKLIAWALEKGFR